MTGVRYEGTPGVRQTIEVVNVRRTVFATRFTHKSLTYPNRSGSTSHSRTLDRSIGEHAQQLDWRISLPVMTFVSGLLAFALITDPTEIR